MPREELIEGDDVSGQGADVVISPSDVLSQKAEKNRVNQENEKDGFGHFLHPITSLKCSSLTTRLKKSILG